jgi:hypothetical protein
MRMRTLVCMAALLVCAVSVEAQTVPMAPASPVQYAGVEAAVAMQTPVATAVNALRWEHLTTDLTSSAVQRFEVCYDTTTPCLSVTTTASALPSPTAEQGGPPAAGHSAFRMALPALTPGNHSVTVKACNSDVCGAASSPLAFRFVVVPGVPNGLGLIPGGGGD